MSSLQILAGGWGILYFLCLWSNNPIAVGFVRFTILVSLIIVVIFSI